MPNEARIVITRILDDDALGSQIEEKMSKLGNAMGVRAQRLVPKKTWKLHDTISTETTRAGAKVTTRVSAGGGEVDYAMHVERGTGRMKAQAYLRPALLQTKPADFRYSGDGPVTRGAKKEKAATSRARRKARASKGGN